MYLKIEDVKKGTEERKWKGDLVRSYVNHPVILLVGKDYGESKSPVI